MKKTTLKKHVSSPVSPTPSRTSSGNSIYRFFFGGKSKPKNEPLHPATPPISDTDSDDATRDKDFDARSREIQVEQSEKTSWEKWAETRLNKLKEQFVRNYGFELDDYLNPKKNTAQTLTDLNQVFMDVTDFIGGDKQKRCNILEVLPQLLTNPLHCERLTENTKAYSQALVKKLTSAIADRCSNKLTLEQKLTLEKVLFELPCPPNSNTNISTYLDKRSSYEEQLDALFSALNPSIDTDEADEGLDQEEGCPDQFHLGGSYNIAALDLAGLNLI